MSGATSLFLFTLVSLQVILTTSVIDYAHFHLLPELVNIAKNVALKQRDVVISPYMFTAETCSILVLSSGRRAARAKELMSVKNSFFFFFFFSFGAYFHCFVVASLRDKTPELTCVYVAHAKSAE